MLALNIYILRAQRTPWDGKKVGINRWSGKWITTINVLPNEKSDIPIASQNAEQGDAR